MSISLPGCFYNYHFDFFVSFFMQAQEDLPEPMNPPRLVNDFARIFERDPLNKLEDMLRTYHDSTSTQIYVLTTTDLKGYDVSDYATHLGEKWKIGQKNKQWDCNSY